METNAKESPLDIQFFIDLERRCNSYQGAAVEAPELLKAWEAAFLSQSTPEDRALFIRTQGAMFLFNAGMIYGKQEERKRHEAEIAKNINQ